MFGPIDLFFYYYMLAKDYKIYVLPEAPLFYLSSVRFQPNTQLIILNETV